MHPMKPLLSIPLAYYMSVLENGASAHNTCAIYDPFDDITAYHSISTVTQHEHISAMVTPRDSYTPIYLSIPSSCDAKEA